MSEDDEKMIMEEDRKQKELDEFRKTIGQMLENYNERELYERVTKPKTNMGNSMIKITPIYDIEKLTLRIDIPIELLKIWKEGCDGKSEGKTQ